MSNRALLAAVIIAVALLGLALLLNKQPTPASGIPADGGAGDAIMPFDPSQVSLITVAREGGVEETVRRAPTGRWMYSRSSGKRAEAAPAEWPASIPSSVTGALGALSAVRPAGVAPAGASVPVGAPAIIIRAGATSHTLHISSESLGGRTLVQVDSRAPAVMDSSIVDPLLRPGPSSWRIGFALPGVRDASRLTLTTPSDQLSLARLEGKWTLRRPVSARASEGVVGQLVESLGAIPVTRFVDDARADAAALGLDRPRLVISAEADERTTDAGGAPASHVRESMLYVGAPASADATQLYAAADPKGEMLFVIPAAALGRLSTAPRNYIAPTATGVAPADVFTVMIRHNDPAPFDRGYRRELGQWSELTGGAKRGGPKQPADGARVNELLEFLASRAGEPDPISPSPAGASTPAPEPMRSLARIELGNLEGDPLDVLNVGYTTDGTLAVRAGGVLVMYPGIGAPAILELPDFKSLPPESGVAPPSGAANPPVK